MKQELFQEACLVLGFFLLAFGIGFLLCWEWGMIVAGLMLIGVGLPEPMGLNRPTIRNTRPPPLLSETETRKAG